MQATKSIQAGERTQIKIGDRVEGGMRGSEDYDTGRVDDIEGDIATVSWDSLVVTPAQITSLRKI